MDGKRCLLLYYTGTFNTRYISKWLKSKMEAAGYVVDLHEIDPLDKQRIDFSPYDLVGLGSPIYGYNAPWPFVKYIRRQKFPKGLRTFIYKDSGETEKINDASSLLIRRKLRRDGAILKNEYHFLMPYNIHFRFDEKLVKEALVMDDKLMDILVYEITHGIPNIKRYKLWPRLVRFFVSIQFIGGDINSFLYKVDDEKCTKCDLCIKRCPTHNIYRGEDGKIKFHHNCLMCMRCSFHCPVDAFDIGFLQDWGWKVNGPYDFRKIEAIKLDGPVITEKTEGFFKCYYATYQEINRKYDEYFKDRD